MAKGRGGNSSHGASSVKKAPKARVAPARRALGSDDEDSSRDGEKKTGLQGNQSSSEEEDEGVFDLGGSDEEDSQEEVCYQCSALCVICCAVLHALGSDSNLTFYELKSRLMIL